ncbi:MAG: hypothetical protein WCJ03_04755 [Bacteroidales bacterium]
MPDLSISEQYKRFKNFLIMRLCLSTGITLFFTFKMISEDSFIEDNHFMWLYLVFLNLFVGFGIFFTFRHARKNEQTYLNGDFNTRFKNYIKFTMYRFSALEISPVAFMVGFVSFGRIYFIIEAIIFYILLAIYFPTKKRLSKEIDFKID